VIRTLAGIVDKSLTPKPQEAFISPDTVLNAAPKIHTEDCIINWDCEAVKIHNLIRGLAPVPGARTIIKNKKDSHTLKIFESIPETEKHSLEPGEIISDGKHYLKIACKKGFINIVTLQLEGKKKMNAIEFLRGFRINGFTAGIS